MGSIRVTLDQLKSEFDIKFRQVKKVLREIDEKVERLKLFPENYEIVFNEPYQSVTMIIRSSRIYVEDWNIRVAGNPYEGRLKDYVDDVEKMYLKHKQYTVLNEILEGIPKLFNYAIRKLEEENRELDRKLVKIKAILEVLK